MTGKAHIFISGFLCQILGIIFFKDFTPLPLIIGSICGLFADIDEPNSTISYKLIRHFGGTKKIAGINSSYTDTKYNRKVEVRRQTALTIVLIFIGIALFYLKFNVSFTFLAFYIAILPWSAHRTLSHSLLSTIIFGSLLYMGLRSYGMGRYGYYAGFGYFAHLIEDMMTVSGVPLFYPFSKKKFRIPFIPHMKTSTTQGAVYEWTVILITLIICTIIYLSKIGLLKQFL